MNKMLFFVVVILSLFLISCSNRTIFIGTTVVNGSGSSGNATLSDDINMSHLVAQFKSALPLSPTDATTATTINCSLDNTQTPILPGFSLVAVGMIALAVFGMISVFVPAG